MGVFSVAVVQMACGPDREANAARAEELVRRAAAAGGQIVLLPELFAGPYFCKDAAPVPCELAMPVDESPLVARMAALARELAVVLPVSFFEAHGDDLYNSLAMLDADGSLMGVYRKSHIPEGPGYHEKHHFKPGDTGFRVFATRYANVGAGVCWDQWFPEAARCMALMGADVLLYPTAIGSEPMAPGLDTRPHWQRVMQGHAGANLLPLAAANRVGLERGASCEITFYGSSFIAGPTGEIVTQAGRSGEAVLCADFDAGELRAMRRDWGLFDDRRPDLYSLLTS